MTVETEAVAGAHNNQPTNGSNMGAEMAFVAAAAATAAAMAAAVATAAMVATAATAAAMVAREIYIKKRQKRRSCLTRCQTSTGKINCRYNSNILFPRNK